MISATMMKISRSILFLLLVSVAFSFSCKKQDGALSDNPDTNQTVVSYLPDTGQTTSYTATKGEDSDFNFHTPSYKDNADGTITDIITGLMWQKTDGGEMTFENSASYCKTLNLGGHNDWRLPTSHELFSLNSFDNVNPALNSVYFIKTLAEYWWTSDLRVDESANVWVVNAGGGIGAHPNSETVSAGGTKKFHVRAVRIPVAIAVPSVHFKDNGDGTVSDNYTGLTWQKLQNPNTLNWEEALSYAVSLTLAGKSDWRIPNIKELQSLNDERLLKPSFNKTFFPNVVSGNYWSSTSQVNSPARAWDLNVDYGIVSYSDKTLRENALCVRGGS